MSSEIGVTAVDEPDDAPVLAAGGKGAKKPPKRRGRLSSIPRLYREVAAEMRKVIWPTRRELVAYSVIVLVFVSSMVAIVAGLDYGFTKAVFAVFG